MTSKERAEALYQGHETKWGRGRPCCENMGPDGNGRWHDVECAEYDGPPDGDAWSGGFAPNH